MKHQAIYCDHRYGPNFGYSPTEIAVYNDCNVSTNSYTSLGLAYTNNTGLNDEIVFTGSCNFQVKEIEVFEITE
jgi:hypothetical protein